MEIVYVKVIALVIMAIISFLVGLLPLKIRRILTNSAQRTSRSQVMLSASLCFGAGVLMGTVFLHLLPETIENVDSAMHDGFIKDTHYPLGPLILCSGFFFMYLLEELVHVWVHSHQTEGDDHHHVHHGHGHHNEPHSTTLYDANTEVVVDNSEMPNGDIAHSDHHEMENPPSLCKNQRKRCESTPSVAVLVGCENPVICTDVLTNCTHASVAVKPIEEKVTIESSATGNTQATVEVNVNPSHSHTVDPSLSTMRSVLVVVALSIHGCLEGLALGLEEEASDVWLLFAALTAHKVAIAFSIGMELLEKEVAIKLYFFYMTLFSIASPLGGVVGALSLAYADDNSAAGAITVMILQGLSGGTILYVVFCEVLERERCKTNGRVSRLIALAMGFSLMACLEIFGEHDHGHGDHEDATTSSLLLSPTMLISN